MKKYLPYFLLALPTFLTPLYGQHPSFIAAMAPFEGFKIEFLDNNEWQIVKHLYDTYLDKKNSNYSPKIPKIIHHIWLGSPLPERCRILRETWIKHHPDWQFILWTEKEIDQLHLQNSAVYHASKNYGSKSDIARYEILYRFGGLYIDTDFECLKPFDEFHEQLTFYTGIGYSPEMLLYNGLIGSIPGHPILKMCIDTMPQQAVDKNNIWDIMVKTGPNHFTRCFFQVLLTYSHESIVVFPTSFFYPWPAYLRFDDSQAHEFIKPESYTLHYWHTSWQKN